MKTYKILYFQKPNLGGTVTGLHDLISGIDKNMFEPVLLFFNQNPYKEKFEKLGIKVITLNECVLSNNLTHKLTNKRDIAAYLRKYRNTLAEGYKNTKEFYNFFKNDLITAFRIVRIIRTEKIDILHNNNNLPGDRAAVLAGFISHIPQICHIRTLRELLFIDKILSRKVNNFIYMSKAIQSLYIKSGINPKRGLLIYDGFNTKDFDNINKVQIKNLQSEFKLNEEDFVVSNVGRLDWWKGHEYFIGALKNVIKLYPSTKALIVGPVHESPEGYEYFKTLKDKIEKFHIKKNVIFTGQRFDIPSIMKISDIIVHSASEPEPFGRVIVEGMLAEKPVIATSAGGVRDIIDDKVSGILDSKSMANAIKFFIQNPEEKKKIAKKARQIAKKRFSINKNSSKVQTIYKKILSV
jgi:glycosyltransferase involved in cell wall biosynthesis